MAAAMINDLCLPAMTSHLCFEGSGEPSRRFPLPDYATKDQSNDQ